MASKKQPAKASKKTSAQKPPARKTPAQDMPAQNTTAKASPAQSGPTRQNKPASHMSPRPVTAFGKGYPWALLADCLLMLIFLFSNGWTLKLDIQLYFVIGAALIFLCSMFQKENRALLFSRISTIAVVLLAQCVLYFVGLFYGTYTKFALREFFMNVGALFVFATAYVSFLRREENSEKLAGVLSAVIVAASLVSIELATSGYLRGVIIKIAELFKAQVAADYGAFETNTRITTILGSPNVFAPIAVLGMFLSLWSSGRVGERTRKSFVQTALSVVSGTAFILCFSLGTILTYVAALVVLVVATPRENRGTHLIRHIYCLVFSLIGAAVVFSTRSLSLLPLLSVAALSLLAALAYTRMRPVNLPTLSMKAKWGAAAVIVAVCAGIVTCALMLHGSYAMAKGATFRRAVALKPGTYSLQLTLDKADATATVDISSMSYAEAALKTKTPLKTAPFASGQAVDFTVPAGAAAVFVTFTADSGLTMTDAVITGGGAAVHVPLKYSILPEFIVNRLQGLWVNDNAIQRFIFFRDGLRIGMRSPIIGLGGGAFEGALFSASDYYYETKHVHNEFIARFIDGGLVGFLLFAALVAAAYRALIKARNSEKLRPLYPVLLALISLMFLHALIEVDFLMVGFRIAAYILFALIAARSGDELVQPRKARTSFSAVFVVTLLLTSVLAFGRYVANKTIDVKNDLQSLQTAMWMDPFNSLDYKLSYLMSTVGAKDPRIVSSQNDYLKSIGYPKVGADVLAEYYLTSPRPDAEKGTKEAENYVHQYRVLPKAWDTTFSLYLYVLNNTGANSDTALIIKASMRNLSAYLDELNKTLPVRVTPDAAILAGVAAALAGPAGK